MKEEWVKAKYHDIIASTEKAVLFLFEQKEIWIPNKLFRFMEGSYIKLPPFIAKDKNIKASKIVSEYHKPKDIKPVYNQEPLIDLKYE
jgi:hypothetical protein